MICCEISLINQVFNIVTMCRSTIFPRRFEGTNTFAFQGLGPSLNAEALRTFETPESTNPATKRHITQQLNFQQSRCGDLRTNEGKSSLHKPTRRVCEWNYSFTYLTSVRDESELLTSRPGRFIPQGRIPVPTMKRSLVSTFLKGEQSSSCARNRTRIPRMSTSIA